MNALYHAGRPPEVPGVTFPARTDRAAKAQATRLLAGGASPGQKIRLAHLDENGQALVAWTWTSGRWAPAR